MRADTPAAVDLVEMVARIILAPVVVVLEVMVVIPDAVRVGTVVILAAVMVDQGPVELPGPVVVIGRVIRATAMVVAALQVQVIDRERVALVSRRLITHRGVVSRACRDAILVMMTSRAGRLMNALRGV